VELSSSFSLVLIDCNLSLVVVQLRVSDLSIF